jgi:hypothetical protein
LAGIAGAALAIAADASAAETSRSFDAHDSRKGNWQLSELRIETSYNCHDTLDRDLSQCPVCRLNVSSVAGIEHA